MYFPCSFVETELILLPTNEGTSLHHIDARSCKTSILPGSSPVCWSSAWIHPDGEIPLQHLLSHRLTLLEPWELLLYDDEHYIHLGGHNMTTQLVVSCVCLEMEKKKHTAPPFTADVAWLDPQHWDHTCYSHLYCCQVLKTSNPAAVYVHSSGGISVIHNDIHKKVAKLLNHIFT